MQLVKKYSDIRETIYYLILQISDSLKFADDFLPSNIASPEELYNLLKSNLIFMHDPPDTELLQSFETMMEGRYWGRRGLGDCDCFVIACCSCFVVLNYPFKIVLAGRTLETPVHIYTKVKDRGSWRTFDLTNNLYGEERYYQYKQAFPIKLFNRRSDL